MFSKILIATDFSPASDCLLQCAVELKALGLRHAVLAHIIYAANMPGLEDILENQLSPELERQKCLLEARGIDVATEFSLAVPAHGLEELAAKHDVDAILIGSRGRGLTRAALGSVSFKLLQITSHPVFLSRINVQGEGDQCATAAALKPFRHILFATDFSDAADRAFGHLKHIVRESGAEATLLHVHDQDHYSRLSGQELREKEDLDRRRLDELKRRMEELARSIKVEWVMGHPAEEIISRARAGRFSLVLMGQHGKGFIREALFGSVANEVARRAEVPVLLVPGLH